MSLRRTYPLPRGRKAHTLRFSASALSVWAFLFATHAQAQQVLGGQNLNGNPPAASIGSESQWYIDFASGKVYGPKTGGAWGSAIGGAAGAVNAATSTPSNPTGTANTTGVMMGLAGSFTPKTTGVFLLSVCGFASNNTASDGVGLIVNYGTGLAPSNGAANTGTSVGQQQAVINGTAGVSICSYGIATGLTIGTTYWEDANVAAKNGGTASIVNVNLSYIELK